jgi:hypothetical protein
MINRRTFIYALSSLAAAAGGIASYAHFWEAKRIRVSKKYIMSDRSPLGAPLKVLHISDLHASCFVSLSFIERAVRQALEEKADLICITGDFITFGVPCYDRYKQILKLLSNTAPTVACFGNHDGGKWAKRGIGYDERPMVKKLLSESNIHILENESENLLINHQIISIVGLDDIWAERFDPPKAFGSADSDYDMRIVLSHNPDTRVQLDTYEWDMLLCGHTHGGEVCIPYIGAPLAPVKDKRYVEGLHYENGRVVHITRGLGSLFGVRINCAPEISLLYVGQA